MNTLEKSERLNTLFLGEKILNNDPSNKLVKQTASCHTSSICKEKEMAEIISLGKINIKILKSEFGTLQTDEIIVTDERIDHITRYES